MFIEDQMRNRSWDKDGVIQYRTECTVNKFEFLSPKSESSQPEMAPADDFEDDEVPF